MPSAVEAWNRKLHVYLGLYFIFFLWLFCLSGVLLNHPGWRIAQFWPDRESTVSEVRIFPPPGHDDIDVARSLMNQLQIRGEVSGSVTRSGSGAFVFRVVRPGDIYDIQADFVEGQARISRIHVNRWGAMNMLHSFSGVRRTDPSLHPNWWVTRMWRFSMDALAAGLLFLVFTGIYIWYSRAQYRRGGLIALLLGVLVLAGFLV